MRATILATVFGAGVLLPGNGAGQETESREGPPPFDTLEAAQELTDGGFSQSESEALAAALVGATEHLQTNAAMESLQSDIDARFDVMTASIDTGFAQMRELIAGIETRQADRINGVIMWVIGVGVALFGAGVGAAGLLGVSMRREGWRSDNFGNPRTARDARIRDGNLDKWIEDIAGNLSRLQKQVGLLQKAHDDERQNRAG